MKVAFVTVVAIALSSRCAIAQLPEYTIERRLAAQTAIANVTSTSLPGWTQPSSSTIAQPALAPTTGTPNGRRTPGGTRPELSEACQQTDKPLTALVPENGKGLTTAEHPIFWFYIPYASEEIHSIEFSLHDRNETTTLYRTSLQLSKIPGVVGIPLPPSPEHALKLNESYHWRLIVNCDRTETSENILELDGWVTRVQQSSNPWYDELTKLAKRYLSEPQNPEVKDAWEKLLKSVGLEELAQAPLVSSVSNSKNG
ncbi:MAG TPA: DUF928 domain-containing protein [Coleofasciculaceae cyanobacterium]